MKEKVSESTMMEGKPPRPLIILIAAVAANRVIGRDNRIPWSIPGEQARFREITMGYPLIMGRRTHESIGHPLPGRRNIVLSRDKGFSPPGVEVASSLNRGLDLCHDEEKVFIIGGQGVFAEALPRAHELILSELPFGVEGDVLFPEFSRQEFTLVSREEVRGKVPWSLCIYRATNR